MTAKTSKNTGNKAVSNKSGKGSNALVPDSNSLAEQAAFTAGATHAASAAANVANNAARQTAQSAHALAAADNARLVQGSSSPASAPVVDVKQIVAEAATTAPTVTVRGGAPGRPMDPQSMSGAVRSMLAAAKAKGVPKLKIGDVRDALAEQFPDASPSSIVTTFYQQKNRMAQG